MIARQNGQLSSGGRRSGRCSGSTCGVSARSSPADAPSASAGRRPRSPRRPPSASRPSSWATAGAIALPALCDSPSPGKGGARAPAPRGRARAGAIRVGIGAQDCLHVRLAPDDLQLRHGQARLRPRSRRRLARSGSAASTTAPRVLPAPPSVNRDARSSAFLKDRGRFVIRRGENASAPRRRRLGRVLARGGEEARRLGASCLQAPSAASRATELLDRLLELANRTERPGRAAFSASRACSRSSPFGVGKPPPALGLLRRAYAALRVRWRRPAARARRRRTRSWLALGQDRP